MRDIKTLAMLKMEKNFIAHNEKEYPRYPYKEQSAEFLFKRLVDEIDELARALKSNPPSYTIHLTRKQAIMSELADCSNLIDYIFEAIQ